MGDFLMGFLIVTLWLCVAGMVIASSAILAYEMGWVS